MRHKVLVVLGILAVIIIAGFRVSQSEDPKSQGQTYNMFSDFSRSDSLYLEPYKAMNWPTDWQVAIRKVWLDIKELNPQYPNPDVIMPGDTIKLPMGMIDIAEYGGKDHMWHSAERFVRLTIYPYAIGATITGIWSDSTASNAGAESAVDANPRWLHVFAIIVLVIIAVGCVIAAIMTWIKQRGRKFEKNPPQFSEGVNARTNVTAQTALRSALGPHVQIIGNVERGYISGEQVMFNADGSSQTETFDNEPGFRARVRFVNGQERMVVCRWSCFNPCWSKTDAKFRGTFRPMNGELPPVVIPAMSPRQVNVVESQIRSAENRTAPTDLPHTTETASAEVAPVGDSPETPKSEVRPEVPSADPQPLVTKAVPTPSAEGSEAASGEVMLHFSELQISNGRLTANGDLAMTFGQFSLLISQITGQSGSSAMPHKANPTPAETAAAKTDAPVAHPDDPHHTV